MSKKWIRNKNGIVEWSKHVWTCGCGALNAGWLDNCGKCGKDKKENQKEHNENYNVFTMS